MPRRPLDPADPSPRARHAPSLGIALALQGGGAHGAYTWGALDALLEDGRFAIEAVSGTSAGALNAAALVEGLVAGDPAGRLARLWEAVGAASPLRSADLAPAVARPLVEPLVNAGLDATRALGTWFSPYQSPGMRMNALESVLRDALDVEALRDSPVPLFVAATSVRTGDIRVFGCRDVTIDALLASACLPDIFRAVEIEGEAYWDGGFMGNPVLQPLVSLEGGCLDVVIVQVTPFVRDALPTTADAIMNRVTEITFNGALLRELRTLEMAQGMIRSVGRCPPSFRRLAALRVHLLPAPDAIARLPAASRLDTRPSHLERLRQLGRDSARRWLAEDAGDVGRTSTLRVETLLGRPTTLPSA